MTPEHLKVSHLVLSYVSQHWELLEYCQHPILQLWSRQPEPFLSKKIGGVYCLECMLDDSWTAMDFTPDPFFFARLLNPSLLTGRRVLPFINSKR